MISIIAVLYFLGIFLHYTHVITVIALLEETPDHKKVVFISVVWPLMTVWYFWNLVLVGGDD